MRREEAEARSLLPGVGTLDLSLSTATRWGEKMDLRVTARRDAAGRAPMVYKLAYCDTLCRSIELEIRGRS